MAEQSKDRFDVSLSGCADEGVFGMPSTLEESALIYIPVPWEATTSYGGGASAGPEAIRKASPQLDFFIPGLANHYQRGFHLLDPLADIRDLNREAKPQAEQIQIWLEKHGTLEGCPELIACREKVNQASHRVNHLVYQQCAELDAQGKYFAVIGGDHSSPYGQICYLSEKYRGDFSLLHIDAHLDLRPAYQGFEFSHASIMHNTMQLEFAPQRLVQVGVRDFSEDEYNFANSDDHLTLFTEADIRQRLYGGQPFTAVVNDIVSSLGERVYISFDIDGLKPQLCPHTGTPVPGGLEFEEARFLIESVVRAGKKIIGFDLCEVCPNPQDPNDEWDGNVGARILFLLSSWMLESLS